MQARGRKMKTEAVHYHSIAGGWPLANAETGKFISRNVICFAVFASGHLPEQHVSKDLRTGQERSEKSAASSRSLRTRPLRTSQHSVSIKKLRERCSRFAVGQSAIETCRAMAASSFS